MSIRVCKEPRNLAVLDLNRDGHEDLAIACSGSNQVAIFTGQGGGTFEKDGLYPVHRTPVSIASGDFNSDRHLDLVVALRNDKLQLLFGNGKGKFGIGPLYEYGDTPTSVTTADFNQDGHVDMGGDQRRTDEQCRLDLARPRRRHLSLGPPITGRVSGPYPSPVPTSTMTARWICSW